MVQDGRRRHPDWEFVGWSDPMEDLAWFCGALVALRPLDRAGGIADRADLYAGYHETPSRRSTPAASTRVAVGGGGPYPLGRHRQPARAAATPRAPSLRWAALTGRMPEIEHDLLLHLDGLERRIA
jgi:hypothetical protein